jgi:hypothetical protein
VISIESRRDGSLEAVVRAADAAATLGAKKSTLEVSIWTERSGIVRARLREQEHGALCYLQGNASLLDLRDALGLRLSR